MRIAREAIKFKDQKDIRVIVFVTGILFFYLLIIVRLFFLQVLNGDYYRGLSLKNRTKLRRLEAPRGKIFDRNGYLIATNVAGYRLVYLNGKKYDEVVIKEISELLNLDKKNVQKLIDEGEIFRYSGENVLLSDMKIEQAHKIMEKLNYYPYLDVLSYPKRKYLFDTFASHLIGYVKSISAEEYENLKQFGYSPNDIIGKKGIEKQYDKILQGKDGYEYIEVDARNRMVKKLEDKKPIPGNDIYLSIDFELQKYISDIYKDTKGSFIALDNKTGEVLVYLSSPEYNSNILSSKMSVSEWNSLLKDPQKPLLDRGMVGSYPPGSIFKPVTSIAILESGIDPKEEIFDEGSFSIGTYVWEDWKETGHGIVNMEKAIVDSCDTYFYIMSHRVGHKKISEVARRFGLGSKTGIDVQGEKTGLVPDREWKKRVFKEPWYSGDTINYSIGQGYLSTTPIQMAYMYEFIANEGFAFKPRVVNRIVSQKEIIEPESIKELENTDKNNYKLVKEGLRKVVTEGTGTIVRIKEIEAAGKTGSAENAHYEETHAWFAGYAPYDKPEVVFLSFVEGAGHGGSKAGPFARAFLKKYAEKREGE